MCCFSTVSYLSIDCLQGIAKFVIKKEVLTTSSATQMAIAKQ